MQTILDKRNFVTASGIFIEDPANITESDINIHDIAVHLANECRYGGAVRYSVAEHSILVSQLIKQSSVRVYGLLHDAHEAYTKDLPSWIKYHTPDLNKIADHVQATIFSALNMRQLSEFPDVTDIVHYADELAFSIEVRAFFSQFGYCGRINVPDSFRYMVPCFDTPGEAARAFENIFYIYTYTGEL